MNTEQSYTGNTEHPENPENSAVRRMRNQAEICLSLLEQAGAAVNSGTPADLFLQNLFRENKKYGSKDRRLITETIFACMRWRGWLEKSDPEHRQSPAWNILFSLAAEGTAPEGIFPFWCEKADFPAERYQNILNLTEKTPAERIRHFTENEETFSDADLIPEWAVSLILPEYRERYFRLLQKRTPLWLRVQFPDRSEEILRELGKVCPGIQIHVHPRVNGAWKTENARMNLNALECYRRGWIEVQDFSSQCIGLAACARPGENWLDLCAGGGGKTLFLACAMAGKGNVTAGDIREFKLREIEKRAARAGLRNVHTTAYSENLPSSLRGKFDGVLADVPCSSSGRWRRNPEARFMMTEQNIREITETQRSILKKAAEAVRPGGVLVYGTCSVFHCENQDNVRWFLKEFPQFRLEPFPNPHSDRMTDGMLQTLPDDADCDGSFAARLRRDL